jgi:hypothetical protein
MLPVYLPPAYLLHTYLLHAYLAGLLPTCCLLYTADRWLPAFLRYFFLNLLPPF